MENVIPMPSEAVAKRMQDLMKNLLSSLWN